MSDRYLEFTLLLPVLSHVLDKQLDKLKATRRPVVTCHTSPQCQKQDVGPIFVSKAMLDKQIPVFLHTFCFHWLNVDNFDGRYINLI